MKKNEVIEKKRKERFELLPTSLPDVQLKVEPGTKPKLPLRTFELFYSLAQTFNRKQWKIDSTCKRQEERKEEIINIAKTNNGLRGIISERDNFSLTAFPSIKNIWDREKLKKSLKDQYLLAVRETRAINVIVPGSREKDEKSIEEAIEKELAKLGIGEYYMGNFIHKEVSIDVDEKELNKIVTDKKIKLPPETKKSEITWKIRVDPLRS